jgi:transglutaminase-like putative cysteine protease
MSILVKINHNTRYSYSTPVFLAPHLIRLRPAPHCRTQILSYSLNIKPAQHSIHWQQDPFNNHIARLIFPDKLSELSLQVEITADIVAFNAYDFFIDDYAMTWPFSYKEDLALDLTSYLKPQVHDVSMHNFLSEFKHSSLSTLDFLIAINSNIYNRLRYVERLESGVQSCDTTLTLESGSCRDSAWLLVQALRCFGLAARFVSGYSLQLVDNISVQESAIKKDSTDLHAWTEVYVPGAGWIGLDPSSGLLAGEGYIPLCCTREPSSAAPVSGLSGACETTLHFENRVTRLSDRD